MKLHESDFLHLHLHTEGSSLDGMIRPSELPKKVYELGQVGAALTDHGVMTSVFRVDAAFKEFNEKNETDLKFIPGIEAYFVPDRSDRKERTNYHMTLLAMTTEGFVNLMRMNSFAWLTGFYYKPRLDWELLERYNEGVICLSGCIAGYVPTLLRMNETSKAWEVAKRFKDLFGDRFYIEYHDHGMEDQKQILPYLLQISRELDLKVVASNDCHYLSQSDFNAHEILLSTQTGTPIFLNENGERKLNPQRFSYEVDEFYVKSTEEMLLRVPPEVLITTREIAERCNVTIEYERELAPSFPLPDGFIDSFTYLKHLSLEGMKKLGYMDKEEYRDRLKRELEVIEKYRFADLLLVVWDYMRWAHEKGIRTGPRGSAAGSLVVHCLGISDPSCDPIAYGLLFERFINEDRVQPPDIDVDFETGGRDRVMEYISDKYGRDHVAAIGTRSVLHVLGCIRDTARALGLGYDVQNRISKELAPWAGEEAEVDLDIGLQDILDSSRYLTSLHKEMPELFEYATRIQGLQRQTSKHAAGAVISRYPLVDIVPLMQRDSRVITQVDMFDVEHLGLLKVDLLGLKSLSIIGKCIELIKENDREAKVELQEITKSDPSVFRFIREESGLGVFQIGTRQMQEYCRRLPISCIDDLAQLIAAYRPSTARAGVTEQYVRVREGRDPIDCYHTLLDDVLRPTGGKMIYQEQIIEVFMLIAGYTRAQADNVRRIMGKMLGEEALSKHKTAFLEGGLSRGLSKELISRLWNDLKYFSIYGFNKSHSVAYALICYHTAYLKYYYPIEFFCACLCFEDDKMKFREFLYQAKQRGIIVKGPCLNSSRESFSIAVEDGERLIRFGLSSVKNCGQKSVEEIVRKQPYKTWEEFLSRVNRTVVNVRVQQYLVMSGAMDSIVNWDEQDPLEEHQKVISKWRNDLLKKINKHDGTDHTCAYYEHESLGEHLLNHPINRYRDRLDASGFRSIRDTLELSAGELSLAGIVARVNETTTKNNQEMAFVKIADETGSIDLIFWPDSWAAYKSQIESARCLAVKGSLSEDRRNIIVRLAREVV